MKVSKLFLALVGAVAFSGAAVADPVLSDLTSADYITVGNLDWAWASPITQQYFYSNELFQADLHAGWREATDAEWASRPDYTAFGGKCASKYWNSLYTHCDFGDTLSQHLLLGSGYDVRDLLYVRGNAPADVPEPATITLLGLGVAGVAASRRKAKKA